MARTTYIVCLLQTFVICSQGWTTSTIGRPSYVLYTEILQTSRAMVQFNLAAAAMLKVVSRRLGIRHSYNELKLSIVFQ